MFKPSAGLLLSDSLHHAFDRLEFSFYYKVSYEAVEVSLPCPSSLVPCLRCPVPARSLMGSFDPCRTVIITSISSWPSQALFAGNITAKHSDPTAFEVAQMTG